MPQLGNPSSKGVEKLNSGSSDGQVSGTNWVELSRSSQIKAALSQDPNGSSLGPHCQFGGGKSLGELHGIYYSFEGGVSLQSTTLEGKEACVDKSRPNARKNLWPTS